jgi:hypothetical protein
LRTPFEGLNPNREDHELYIDVFPRLGLTVGGKTRFQFNIILKKGPFEEIKEDIVLPILWVDASPEELSEEFIMFLDSIEDPIPSELSLAHIVSFLVATFSLIMIMLNCVVYFGNKRHEKEVVKRETVEILGKEVGVEGNVELVAPTGSKVVKLEVPRHSSKTHWLLITNNFLNLKILEVPSNTTNAKLEVPRSNKVVESEVSNTSKDEESEVPISNEVVELEVLSTSKDEESEVPINSENAKLEVPINNDFDELEVPSSSEIVELEVPSNSENAEWEVPISNEVVELRLYDY